MGQQIIRQPDGKFAVFSSVVDGFLTVDETAEEIVQWRMQEAAEKARESTEREIRRVLNSDSPYGKFTLTWEEASAMDGKGGER